jgi:flagellar basal body rod protein FlgC
VVVLNENGQAKVCPDDSAFTKRYEPGHPDAGADGMVLYPNVDLATEGVICQEASRECLLAAEILRRLEPTMVIAGIEAGDPFGESDSESD